MPYSLQLLRELIETHPDRAERLRAHVDALEASIEAQPVFCLQHVRTLFEAAHASIAPRLSIQFPRNSGFPARMRSVIEAMDFSIADHPEADRINEYVGNMLKGIDDTAVALAQLSNVPNMRHGGSLDWGTLERQHARMLGGLCDALVAFLFDVAWSRADAEPADGSEPSEGEREAFNNWIDDRWGEVNVAGSVFPPSFALYRLDPLQYDNLRLEWQTEADEMEIDEEQAA